MPFADGLEFGSEEGLEFAVVVVVVEVEVFAADVVVVVDSFSGNSGMLGRTTDEGREGGRLFEVSEAA